MTRLRNDPAEDRRTAQTSQDSPQNLRRSREAAKSPVPTHTTAAQVTVGVSLKTYFGNTRARRWCVSVADRLRSWEDLHLDRVEIFVIPTYLQIHDALTALRSVGVGIGAQDVSPYPPGAYTGEVTAAELAEIGVRFVEVGHAERRRLFGETDEVVACKIAEVMRADLTPVICVGEAERMNPLDAAAATLTQIHSALAGAPEGRVIVAYEPAWAIGVSQPAPVDHIAVVTRALRDDLASLPGREGSAVIYGGSARAGLLTDLSGCVDGLFLGRSAHDPDQLMAVLDEASALAGSRQGAAAGTPA